MTCILIDEFLSSHNQGQQTRSVTRMLYMPQFALTGPPTGIEARLRSIYLSISADTSVFDPPPCRGNPTSTTPCPSAHRCQNRCTRPNPSKRRQRRKHRSRPRAPNRRAAHCSHQRAPRGIAPARTPASHTTSGHTLRPRRRRIIRRGSPHSAEGQSPR